MSRRLSELVVPAGGGISFGAAKRSILCVYFCLGLSGFPGWWVSRADRAGGCSRYLAASTNPQALLPLHFSVRQQ